MRKFQCLLFVLKRSHIYYYIICMLYFNLCRWILVHLLTLVYTAWKVSKYEVFSGPFYLVFGLNTEIYTVFFLVHIFLNSDWIRRRSKSLYSIRMQENTDQKKLRIWTLFRQWYELCKQKQKWLWINVMFRKIFTSTGDIFKTQQKLWIKKFLKRFS